MDTNDVEETLKQALLGVEPTVGKETVVDVNLQTSKTKPAIKVDDLSNAKNRAQNLLDSNIQISFLDKTLKPSIDELGTWVDFSIDDSNKYLATVNQEQVKGWVSEASTEAGKDPINKKVKVEAGIQTTIQEGVDGLVIDQDAVASQIINNLNLDKITQISYKAPGIPLKYQTVYNDITTIKDGKFIEVNISTQTVYAWEDGQLVYTSPATTGASGNDTGTPIGTFSIFYKTTDTILDGRVYGYSYRVHVDYWMPFDVNGSGLHDASWRTSFGGQDYIYSGSKGCVNLPHATAEFLYNWAPVGTVVWTHY